MIDPQHRHSKDWLQPPEEREGLQRYVETLRERKLLVIGLIAITTLIAIVYVLVASKTYEAQANLLITPISSEDPVLISLGLLHSSADPTRDVQTASTFVDNMEVATRVHEQLNGSETPRALLEKISVAPVAGSNIVAVTASAGSPHEAALLANSFATQAIDLQTEQMHEQIGEQLERLEAQVTPGEEGEEPTTAGSLSLEAQIAELKILSTSPNPTIRLQTKATEPTAPSSPKRLLSLLGGIFAGLILGIGAAFASQALDPRLRRESQLRHLYKLPILCRIPKEGNSGRGPISPDRVTTMATEGYRMLRATLTGAARRSTRGGMVTLVTGSSASEGKTTTAVNLAASLALAGNRVILIESDLRHPVLARVLKSPEGPDGVVSVLVENKTLSEALVPSDAYGSSLRILFADYSGGWIADLFSIPAAEQLIEDARLLADHVIIDSPPLNEVIDALPLARMADAVVLIARLGVTRIDKLGQLAELLAENDVMPSGFALLGTPRPNRGQSPYYSESREARQAKSLQRR
jgi:receptor protein-tyrosine kinase